ncbi:hypothetical protein DLM45_12255 [Hyphomicrobium methylovorum]|nr:hypothetical protein [Hyphomicrobium methylovorum]
MHTDISADADTRAPLEMEHSQPEAGLSEVMSYLRTEFPQFDIARIHENEDEIVLQLKSLGQVHIVRVHRSFLERTSEKEISERLTSFRLASVLRDLGNLPVALTPSGCIFM